MDIDVFRKTFERIFPNIEMLSLHGNRLCPDGLSDSVPDYSYEEYKVLMIRSFPKLKFLDHTNVSRIYTGSEVIRNVEIIKFHPIMILEKLRFRKQSDYSPLLDKPKVLGQHTGKISYRDYKYIDKNSEGNRYIVDADL